MTAIQLVNDIFWTGVNVRTDDKFEGMWPIPHGVSLNSYIVKGKQTALIDLVREWKGSAYDFYRQLESAGVKPDSIDYIVMNHLEPDHTEALLSLLRSAPQAKIVTTQKGAELVKAFYEIDENIHVVSSGDTLDLGGKTLVFYEIPYVHWPETMVTYAKEDQILFSCDAFGSFGALDGGLFDDEVEQNRVGFWERETLRYYANIVSRYSSKVLDAIDKLAGLDIKIIAPSHGLIWRGDPGKIVQRYDSLARYSKGEGLKPKITFVFGTMYGNTEAMANAVLRGISKVKGVELDVFEVPGHDNNSEILASAWESGGLVLGMPTYEGKMFPPMHTVIDLFVRKGFKHKQVLRFGSYGWSGGAQREFEQMITRLNWDLQPPIEYQGGPTTEDLRAGEQKGEEFARLIKERYAGK
ncbi:MAG: FprA family A-type flavoprotein [Candidatus Ranarchaeia archaeon]